MNLCEAGTSVKGFISNRSDRTWDVDAGEAGTSSEGIVSNGSDRVRDRVVIRAFTTRISNDSLYILIK